MPCQVHFKRGNRYTALLDRVEIGALAGILAAACRAHPVDWPPVRILVLQYLLGLVAKTEPCRV